MKRLFHQSAVDVGMQLFSALKRQIFVQLQQCPEDYHYVMPVGGFGELVFTLSQSHHLRRQGKVCILLRDDRAYLTRLWPEAADHFLFVNAQQFELLRSLEDLSFRSPGWLYICFADLFADGRFALDLVLNNNRLTMKECYAYALGLPLGVPVSPPVVDHLNVQLPANGRKNILVIQHANTIKRIPSEFWVALSQRLVQRGYNLLVDAIADLDIIAGAPSEVRYYRTQVNELLGLARAADAVIALRSGMADLIGAMLAQPGTSKMLVLYHVTAGFGDGPRSFHHSAGISRSGLSLSKSYSTDRIIDAEVASDDRTRLISEEADRIAELAAAAAG